MPLHLIITLVVALVVLMVGIAAIVRNDRKRERRRKNMQYQQCAYMSQGRMCDCCTDCPFDKEAK